MYDNFKTANYANALLSPELYARHLSRLFTGDVVDGFTVVPGTGLQVVLQPGNAFIRYGSAGVASAREVSLVSTFNLTIGTPDASNPRNDLVVLYVDNAVALPGGTPTSANLDGLGVAKAKIVPGTASATPTDPNSTAIQASVGAGNPYTILARVRVDNGMSVIASNKITDLRSLAKVPITAMSFTKTVDANGWTVYDYGTWKEYERSDARSGGLGAGGTGVEYTVTPPTGISITDIKTIFGSLANEYDASLVTLGVNLRTGNIYTSLRNNYTSSVNINGKIHLRVRV